MDDPIKQSLQEKLNQRSLSSPQVQEGITECFVLTNRQFLRHRMGDKRPIDEIDRVTRDLVNQVFAEVGALDAHPTLGTLRQAWHALDKQLGFEADPKLLEHHRQLIQRLFDLAKSGPQT
jgi:hypothetical protein